MLGGVRFPTWTGRRGFAVEEFARRHGDFAIAGAVVAVAIGDDDRVTRCGIGLIGLGSTPLRATAAEAEIVGRPIGELSGDELGRLATASLDNVPDRPQRLGGVPATGRSGHGGAGVESGEHRGDDGSGHVSDEQRVRVTVNGREWNTAVESRITLADFLRERCGLTGTHLGCEHGVCGACTVLVDGAAVRSCLMFAVQADGCEVTTVEGIASPDGTLSPVQEALRECHGLQCGFCTPGFVVSITALLGRNPDPTDEEIRVGLSGNVCRCTGYQGIIAAVRSAAVTIGSSAETAQLVTAAASISSTIADGLTREAGDGDAERSQRVGDRVDDGRCGTDGAALAHALVAAGAGSRATRRGRTRSRAPRWRWGAGSRRTWWSAGCRRRRRRSARAARRRCPARCRPAIWPSTTFGLIIGPQSSRDDVTQQLDRAGGEIDLAGAHVGGVGPDHGCAGGVAARSPRARLTSRRAARRAGSRPARPSPRR